LREAVPGLGAADSLVVALEIAEHEAHGVAAGRFALMNRTRRETTGARRRLFCLNQDSQDEEDFQD
jgi:hypothetical protein